MTTQERDRLTEAIIEEPEEVPRSSWVLVGQFFVVPVVIVAICVGIIIAFGLITRDPRTPRDLLEEVKAGKGDRWQAAFELSKFIGANGNENDPNLARDLVLAFRGARDDDPRIRQYLALAIGKSHSPLGVQPLIEALDDGNPDVRLYSAWALGELSSREAVDPLIKLIESPDDSLRKMAVYSLGRLQDSRAVPYLKAALNDRRPDLSWNAALALARLKDPSGLDVLHKMLDRNYLNSLSDVSEDQKSEAMINSIHGIALLKDASARSQLMTVGSSDPNVKVRSEALSALKQLP
jgi:HEAT repeat protein